MKRGTNIALHLLTVCVFLADIVTVMRMILCTVHAAWHFTRAMCVRVLFTEEIEAFMHAVPSEAVR